ncbi:MAG: hypothetical protein B6244_14855 [Candidatus Cloacimonetes bacterium 4572_55]|nr:MAG: hypothetical protein B6244_14855 [Candidatus Cloacimonetes bacterium 4572_55]
MALIHQGTRDTLQAIDIADINDNDTAIIYFQSRSRTFTFDNASTEAEKIVRPGPFYLRPHDYSTAGVWVETIGNDYDVFNAGQLIGSKLTSSNWGLSLGSEFDLDAGTIKLGGSAIPEFSVTAAGILTATGATIAGTITATAGAIGGWEIGADTLEASSGEVGLSSAVTGWDDIRIWAGHATPSSAPFKVTESGALTASSGAIGGFTLGATTLTATDLILDSGNQRIKLGSGNDLIALDADDATYRLTIGHATYASAPFRVTKAGVLTAIGATISGSLTSGALTATGGTIGGFTINSTAGLYAGSGATRVQMKPGVGIWTGATAQTDAKNYLDVDGSGWLADGNISWTAAGLLTQTLADGGSITLDAGADITLEGDDAIGDKGIIQFGDDVRMGAIDSTPFFDYYVRRRPGFYECILIRCWHCCDY